MILDVAPGVDWTAVCGIMMCVQQVHLYLFFLRAQRCAHCACCNATYVLASLSALHLPRSAGS